MDVEVGVTVTTRAHCAAAADLTVTMDGARVTVAETASLLE